MIPAYRLMIAVGHSNGAIAGITLPTVCQGREPSGVTIPARGGADVFSVFRRREGGAHGRPRMYDDLATAGAALSQRHLGCLIRSVPVPAPAALPGLYIPGDGAVMSYAFFADGAAKKWPLAGQFE